MKANVELNLKPFTVPNFVVYDGFQEDSSQRDSVSLAALSEETLYALCKQFVQDVYKKASKKGTPQLCKAYPTATEGK